MRRLLVLCITAIMMFSLTNCSVKPDSEKTSITNEESNVKAYESVDGWAIKYPSSWDKVDQNFMQEESTGKTVEFYTESCTKEELDKWVESEIERKLGATEAENTLEQSLQKEEVGELLVYTYTIKSKIESSENLLKNTIFFDGEKRYEFRTQLPPVTEMEFDEIIKSFKIIQ